MNKIPDELPANTCIVETTADIKDPVYEGQAVYIKENRRLYVCKLTFIRKFPFWSFVKDFNNENK